MAGVGPWKPIRDTHAIQLAAIGISFADSIPSRAWERVRSSVAEKARQLGLEKEEAQATLQFAFGPSGPVPVAAPQNAPPLGVSFMHMERSDFFSDRLTIGRQAIRYEEWSYTRWAALLQKATDAFQESFDQYSDAIMSTIYVDYVDVFAAEFTEGKDWDSSLIINPMSDLVAAAAFDQFQQWHTYSGHFELIAPDIRRLHQVNIDVSDTQLENAQARAIQIRTIITDQMNLPMLSPFPAEKQTWQVVRERLENLHRVANATVKRILTETAANAISLRVE